MRAHLYSKPVMNCKNFVCFLLVKKQQQHLQCLDGVKAVTIISKCSGLVTLCLEYIPFSPEKENMKYILECGAICAYTTLADSHISGSSKMAKVSVCRPTKPEFFVIINTMHCNFFSI